MHECIILHLSSVIWAILYNLNPYITIPFHVFVCYDVRFLLSLLKSQDANTRMQENFDTFFKTCKGLINMFTKNQMCSK